MACGRPGCGSQVRPFTARLSIQAHDPHLSHLPPCLTPASLCSLIPGIMLLVETTELSKLKEDLQDPGEARALWRCSTLGLRRGRLHLPQPPPPQSPALPLWRPCPWKL